MRKVLILGANGFIGGHLSRHLDAKGFDVIGLDVSGTASSKFLIGSGLDENFPDLLKTVRPDFVINCAGAANVGYSFEAPETDFNLNTVMVFRVLEALRLTGVAAGFLQLSSAAVYGNPQQFPVNEDHRLDPVSPYGFHKYQAELICREYHSLYRQGVAILRVFSAYGVGLKKQIFWDIYQKTLRGTDIELFGTGEESRDFINVHDVTQAIECILSRSAFDCSVYNVGNGNEVCIKDAVKVFLKELDFQGSHRFVGSNRSGDPLNWCADIERLKGIGYRQQVSLERGLSDYANWIKEQA